MSNIATTIEQSKRLLVLGLDIKSADMCLCKTAQDTWFLCAGTPGEYDANTVPAWSLSALLEVIPAMIVYPTWVDKRPTDVWFNLDKDYNSESKKQFYMCYYKSLDTHQLAKMTNPSHSSPIDAVYEMVCWLLERGLIKKGGEQ